MPTIRYGTSTLELGQYVKKKRKGNENVRKRYEFFGKTNKE